MFKKLLITVLILVFVYFSALLVFRHYKDDLIDHLSQSRPVEANYLIVEGWISDESIADAVKEFRDKDYYKLITTGGPLETHYTLFVEGFLEFDFSENEIFLFPGDTISINLRGSPYNNIYPEFLLYLNEIKVLDNSVNEKWEEYHYIVDSPTRIENITLSYENDGYSDKDDRNLSIKSLRINDSIIPPRSENIYFFYDYDINRMNPWSTDIHSFAELCAKKLMSYEKLSPDSIIILPAPQSNLNRTYNSALSVKDWIDSEKLKRNSFNVLSEGIHCRRTWVIYKMTLSNQSENIGIISNYELHSVKNTPEIDNISLLEELTGMIYYKYLFKNWINIKARIMPDKKKPEDQKRHLNLYD